MVMRSNSVGMKRLSRRDFIKSSGSIITGCAVSLPFFCEPANSFASCNQLRGSTIRWIVPTQAVGSYNTYSRLLKPFLEQTLGSIIVIENVAGAGTRIGSRKLMRAAPDGRTLGILNGSGLLAAFLTSDQDSPHPANDFTVLGRISRSRQIWATGNKSAITSIFDILTVSPQKLFLGAITDVGSTNFVNLTITSSFLGINVEPIAGFKSSRDCMMAAIRGEVDLAIFSFESGRDLIYSGALRPLLQISTLPVSDDPVLGGVPILGGEDGVAALRDVELGRKKETGTAWASALEGLTGAGRIIAAPPDMGNELKNCLQAEILRALSSPGLQEAAEKLGEPLDIADATKTVADLAVAAAYMAPFRSIVQDAVQKVLR